MPDKTIEESEATIEEASDDVVEAEAALDAGDEPEARARLAAAEDRLNKAETALADLYAQVQARASSDHDHPIPSHLSAIEEHLSQMEREEQDVKRLPWTKRPLMDLIRGR